MPLKQTPLFQTYKEIGCKMIPFAGWEMPITFTSLIEEHEAVRQNAGIFDISHMGVLLLKGIKTKEAVQKLVPSDLFRIGPGEACYTVLLNKDGGIIDDLIIYDLGTNKSKQDSLVLVINAACNKTDLDWLTSNLAPTITISDYKADGCLLAIQGPRAKDILDPLFEQSIASIPRFGHRQFHFNPQIFESNKPIFIGRTGYTGEEGFECLLPQKLGLLFWKELINQGVKPCGLGARDTLRLEAGMHLYGNDINLKTTPFEAGLGWLVHLEMPASFIGREALEQQTKNGINQKLVGLTIEGRSIARKGHKIIHNTKYVGEITSGSWSPTLKKAIALAYIPKELSKMGTLINVEIRGKTYSAQVVQKPFYRKNY